jgi:hypothetical protein
MRVGSDRFTREKTLPVLGKKIAAQRAFLRFGDPVTHRLAHFARHEPREFVGLGAQKFSGFAQQRRPCGETRAAPFDKGPVDVVDDPLDCSCRHLLVRRDDVAGYGTDGVDGHERPPSVAIKYFDGHRDSKFLFGLTALSIEDNSRQGLAFAA